MRFIRLRHPLNHSFIHLLIHSIIDRSAFLWRAHLIRCINDLVWGQLVSFARLSLHFCTWPLGCAWSAIQRFRLPNDDAEGKSLSCDQCLTSSSLGETKRFVKSCWHVIVQRTTASLSFFPFPSSSFPLPSCPAPLANPTRGGAISKCIPAHDRLPFAAGACKDARETNGTCFVACHVSVCACVCVLLTKNPLYCC